MTRLKASANLGFLWSDLPLPQAIRNAAAYGFDAVECHWPYAHDPDGIRAALDETGLPMLGLNTSRGDTSAGENGLSALIGREADARGAIDQAVSFADRIDAGAIHVMAGFAEGDAARETFLANLVYACNRAGSKRTILIEPLNRYDAPGYFLKTTDQARSIIEDAGQSNLKLMFDCYHVQIMEGDLTRRLEANLDIIGHIQIASVPDRTEPDQGEINYAHVFEHLRRLGYARPIGAEYRSKGAVEKGLGWMDWLSGSE